MCAIEGKGVFKGISILLKALFFFSLLKVDSKFKDIMVNLFDNIDDAAKRYGFPGNYVAGANIAGFEKVVDAMNAQGIV